MDVALSVTIHIQPNTDFDNLVKYYCVNLGICALSALGEKSCAVGAHSRDKF